MNVKENTVKLVDNLDTNINCADVKEVVMNEYKKETGDSTADAIAAVVLCLVFVACSILWISSQ
jgi:hypothetical protein